MRADSLPKPTQNVLVCSRVNPAPMWENTFLVPTRCRANMAHVRRIKRQQVVSTVYATLGTDAVIDAVNETLLCVCVCVCVCACVCVCVYVP